MVRAFLILIVLLIPRQDDPAARAQGLIERLRSGAVEEREEAARRLREMGPAAVPALNKAAEDRDAEVAARARHALKWIEIRGWLPDELARSSPRLIDRLASGEDEAWTEAFLHLANEAPDIHSLTLRNRLRPMAERAVRGARGKDEKINVFRQVLRIRAPEALPALAELVLDPDEEVSRFVSETLPKLGARAAARKLISLLAIGGDRGKVVVALGQLDLPGTIPTLISLLEDPEHGVRERAVGALVKVGPGDHLERIASLLGHREAGVRDAAAKALGLLGSEENSSALTPLLKDPDPEVRGNTAEAMGHLGSRDQAGAISVLLNEESAFVRWHAVRTLGTLGARESIPAIAQRLADPDRAVPLQAAEALAKLGARDHAREIAKLLGKGNEDIRPWVMVALAQLGSRDAAPEVLRLLEDEDPATRGSALDTLAAMGAREAVPKAVGLLKDEDAGVRRSAVRAVAALMGREAVPVLLPLLKEKERAEEAADALQRLGAKEAIPGLVDMLASDSSSISPARQALECLPRGDVVRAVAAKIREGPAPTRPTLAEFLGELYVPAAIPYLMTGIEDGDAGVRRSALSALHFLEALEAVPAIARRLHDPNPDVRCAAARTLAEMGAVRTVPEITRIISDKDAGPAALSALVTLGAREAVPEIFKVLKGPDPGLRRGALITLGRLGVREAVPGLLELLRDPSSNRVGAMEALAAAGAREAAPEIAQFLRSDNGGERAAAAGALGRLGAREAASEVIRLLDDTHAFVRMEAAKALGSMEAREAIPALVLLLEDEEEHARGSSFDPLVRMKAKEAVPSIRTLLKEGRPEARRLAVGVLAAIDPQGSAPLLRESLRDFNSSVRASAALALADLGDREAIPGLLRALGRPRRAAGSEYAVVTALGRLGAVEAIPLLERMSEDPEEPALFDAIPVLKKLGGRVSLQGLAGALRDKNIYNDSRPRQALRLLGQLGAKECVPAIRESLKDWRHLVRVESAEALCLLGSRDGVETRLEEGNDLFCLNALRAPAARARLSATPPAVLRPATKKDAVESLARAAGMTVKWPDVPAGEIELTIRDPEYNEETSVLEHLERIRYGGYEMVLEEDRLRFIYKSEALQFWKRWWEGEKEKK